jgi:hypothetical protein
MVATSEREVIMNIIFWRDDEAEAVNTSSDVAVLTPQPTERRQPVLLVIEGSRDQLVADIEHVADDLRALERRLAAARKELHRLLASLGPISMTMNWRR